MTPTNRVTQIQAAPTRKVDSKPIQQAGATPSGPPSIYFDVTSDINERQQTIFNNLKNDFKPKECSSFMGIKSPWCQDSYVFEPDKEVTCGDIIERYGLNKDEIVQHGLLKELCGNSEAKSNAPIELPKEYFDKVMKEHQVIVGM